VPSARGRPDEHLLVTARIAVVAPFVSAFPLALLNVWAARGVVLAGVGVLLWALLRSRGLPDPEGERSFTGDFGSLVLVFAMLLTGLTPLAAVPAALFAVRFGQAVVETHTKRRKQHEKRERKVRASAHFAQAKAKNGISPD
jgi:hypothetical protein